MKTLIPYAGNIYRPAGDCGTIIKKERKDSMLHGHAAIRGRHCCNINDAAVWIDDGGARYTERVDVSARELGPRYGASEIAKPDL
jgi:hypothetical protein